MRNSLRKGIDIFALFLPEIKELIQAKDFNSLKAFLKTIHSVDLAGGWKYLEPQEKIIVFKLLGAKKAVEVFEDLKFAEQTYILNNLDNAELAQIVNQMAPDERADLFKELPNKVFRKFLSLVKKEDAQDIRRLMVYKEGTAGSLMTTELVELKKEMSARQAILSIQENLRAEYRENIYSVFVTDENRKLIGSISLQDLLKAPPDIFIRDIMGGVEFIKVDVETDIKEVANRFKKYDLLDIPVIDKDNILLGIITVDDIVEIVERQTTREIYEIGKMTPKGGETISYAKANALELVKRRAGWLIFLLVCHFGTGAILKNFEVSLQTVVALAFFIPMLLDTAGNAGTQTSISIIRGLATGDVNFKNVFEVIRLEFSTAFLMGLIISSITFLRAFHLQRDFALAWIVGLTMLVLAILGIITGIFLPLLSKKIGLDPAVLAGPIITTVVDIAGLIVYFKIAQVFIPALRF